MTLSALGIRQVCLLTRLRVSDSFDTIDCIIALHKLYSLHGNSLAPPPPPLYFQPCLTDRIQSVATTNDIHPNKEHHYGIPCGSAYVMHYSFFILKHSLT